MPLKQGCLQVEKKANRFIPVRLANRKEIKELLCGTSYCPACDCEVVGERLMNKLPIYIGGLYNGKCKIMVGQKPTEIHIS